MHENLQNPIHPVILHRESRFQNRYDARDTAKQERRERSTPQFFSLPGILDTAAVQSLEGFAANPVRPVTFPRNATFYFMGSMIYDSYINREGVSMRIVDSIKVDRSVWRRWSFVAGVMRREMIVLVV